MVLFVLCMGSDLRTTVDYASIIVSIIYIYSLSKEIF